MKKETTSDKLKEAFEKNSLGKASDWKRLSKKSEPGVGTIRVFENKKSGAQIEVTEKGDDVFEIKPLTLQKTFSTVVSGARQDPIKPLTLNDFIDQDPARNKAADELMVAFYGDDVTDRTTADKLREELDVRYGKSVEEFYDRDDIFDDLRQKAGETAINNRYLFGIEPQDEDNYYIWTTPVKYFEKKGGTTDQTGYVSPGYWDAMESCFESTDDLETTIRTVLKKGLQWNEEYQDSIINERYADAADKKALIDKIKSIIAEYAPAKPDKTPKPPKP